MNAETQKFIGNQRRVNDYDCTVIMITYERPEHAKRAMSYWSGSGMSVIIADGSKESQVDIPPLVNYMHLPGTSVIERLCILIDNVKTKYSVIVPDDDFIGYEGLKKAINFLGENQGYAGTQGIYTQFFINQKYKKIISRPGNYEFARDYHCYNDSYIERLKDINSYFIMFYCYCVVTYDVLKTFKNLVADIKDPILGSTIFEPLMGYAIAINGKVKTLETFHCARETLPVPDWFGVKSFEFFIEEDSSDYKTLVDNMANECVRLHGGNKTDVIEIVRMASATYVKSMLHRREVSSKKLENSESYFLVLVKYLKRTIASVWRKKSKGINLKYFKGDQDSLIAYKKDWKVIEKVLNTWFEDSKVSQLKKK